MTVTYAIANVMCAIVIVKMPRPEGKPIACSKATNSNSIAMPVMISGITSGAVVIAERNARPRNGPKRVNTTPAKVPRITAPLAVIAATLMEIQAAPSSWSFSSNRAYHRSVGELSRSQTVTRRELLNENTIIERIGT